jgi:hypothetical protein
MASRGRLGASFFPCCTSVVRRWQKILGTTYVLARNSIKDVLESLDPLLHNVGRSGGDGPVGMAPNGGRSGASTKSCRGHVVQQ